MHRMVSTALTILRCDSAVSLSPVLILYIYISSLSYHMIHIHISTPKPNKILGTRPKSFNLNSYALLFVYITRYGYQVRCRSRLT